MKKLEEDETIKDKGEQTRAAYCTLPKKPKPFKNAKKCQKHSKHVSLEKSFRFHITKKNANFQELNLKYVRLSFENMMLLQNGCETRSILTK